MVKSTYIFKNGVISQVGDQPGYDENSDSNLVLVQNPHSAVNGFINWDTTNVADGTYYPSATGSPIPETAESITITGSLIDGAGETTTLTWEVTNDEDTTNASWINVIARDLTNTTETYVQSKDATEATTTYAVQLPTGNFRHIRLKIASSAATNTVIAKVRVY